MYFKFFVIFMSLIFTASFSQEKLYKDGEILVKFRTNKNQSIIKQSGGEVGDYFKLFNIYRVKLKDGVSVEDAINELKKSPDVEYAEPNYIVRKMETFPNDPYFDVQWGLKAINMPKAWGYCKGGSIVVAVLDSGVDYNHPDLKDNLWKNEREICDNQKDDDGNGFVDDCYGWNFVYNNNNIMDDDTDSHGTHVAGIIGAVGNNKIGIAGVNWNIKIMPVKFLDSNGSSDVATVIKAIEYAVMMGAKVINASYGYPSSCGVNITPSKAEEEAIRKAKEWGVLFVAAAGNYGCNNDVYPFYPASYKIDNIVSVLAVDQSMRLSRLSNYGKNSVHIAMPGVNIFSTVRTNIKDGYDYKSGTSMAAPFFSGLAALLMSCKGYNYIQAKEAILATAVKKSTLENYTITGGIADAYAALMYESVANLQPISNLNPESDIKIQPKNDQTQSSSSGCSTISISSITISYVAVFLIVLSLRIWRFFR